LEGVDAPLTIQYYEPKGSISDDPTTLMG